MRCSHMMCGPRGLSEWILKLRNGCFMTLAREQEDQLSGDCLIRHFTAAEWKSDLIIAISSFTGLHLLRLGSEAVSTVGAHSSHKVFMLPLLGVLLRRGNTPDSISGYAQVIGFWVWMVRPFPRIIVKLFGAVLLHHSVGILPLAPVTV